MRACFLLIMASALTLLVTGCEDIRPSLAPLIGRTELPTPERLSIRPAPTSTPAIALLPNVSPSPSPAPTFRASPTSTATPVLTPTPAIRLQNQLPRDVFESFHGAFYGGCEEPPFESLKVAKRWSAQTSGQLEFTPSTGTYFLVVVGAPQGPTWRFDSVIETGTGRKQQSLHIDSNVQDDLTDAQEWCTVGFGRITPEVLNVQATNISWTVYLITSSGTEPLPRAVGSALAGYYSNCPSMPPISILAVSQVWTSAEGLTLRPLDFTGSPPHYFLGVRFEPAQREWYFQSVNVSGDWRAAGPSVNSKSGERIDFTAICPSTAGLHHLDVQAEGGTWTIFLITVLR